jgi:hypothetical protein
MSNDPATGWNDGCGGEKAPRRIGDGSRGPLTAAVNSTEALKSRWFAARRGYTRCIPICETLSTLGARLQSSFGDARDVALGAAE